MHDAARLLAGSWLPRRRQWVVRLLAAAACLVALAITAFTAAWTATVDFGTSYTVNAATNTVRVVVTAATQLVICLAANPMRDHPRGDRVLRAAARRGRHHPARRGQRPVAAVAAYLLASIPGYALAGFRKDTSGTEAAMK